jgi:hypothetical protein
LFRVGSVVFGLVMRFFWLAMSRVADDRAGHLVDRAREGHGSRIERDHGANLRASFDAVRTDEDVRQAMTAR